jgi:hypothetical protein
MTIGPWDCRTMGLWDWGAPTLFFTSIKNLLLRRPRSYGPMVNGPTVLGPAEKSNPADAHGIGRVGGVTILLLAASC